NMSCSLIAGMALLQNARIIDQNKPLTLMVDAGFYLGDSIDPAIACLHLYNGLHVDFSEESINCFVIASVTQFDSNATTFSSVLCSDEYDLMGDIIYVCFSYQYNTRLQPFMMICGQAENIQECPSTFDVKATQYVSHLASIKNWANGQLPLRIEILDSPCYMKNKLMPKRAGTKLCSWVTQTACGTHRLSIGLRKEDESSMSTAEGR
ncbi:hypothetical protein WOLCODRAFT_80400, partial [Wolfiporia cocos MD-104 SS10]